MRRSEELMQELIGIDQSLGELSNTELPEIQVDGDADEIRDSRAAYDSAVVELRNKREALLSKRKGVEERRLSAVAQEEVERDKSIPTEVKSKEEQERIELRSRASMKTWIDCGLRGAVPNPGTPEAEYASELNNGMLTGNQGGVVIPFEYFDDGPTAEDELRSLRAFMAGDKDAIEQRAVTIATGARDSRNDPVLARLFADTAAAFMLTSFPAVPAGTSGYPVLATGASPPSTSTAKGAAISVTDTTVTVNTLTPAAVGAAYTISAEDKALLGSTEAVHRNDLMETVRQGAFDSFVLAGFDSGITDPTTATNQETWTGYAGIAADHVDGTYAGSRGEVRILLTQKQYRDAAKLFFASRTVADVTAPLAALDYMTANSGGVRMSTRITNADADNAYIARGRGAGAVAPMWGGIELINDIYTGALKREQTLIAYVMTAFTIRLAGKYAKRSIDVA